MTHVLASELRESVLRAALEGKLTTQSSNDTSVYVTLDKVKEIKKHLIKKGEMKKEKPLEPVNDDEQNFDIPDGWIWTRMQNFLDVRDGTHDSPKYVADGYPFVTSKNLINGSISFDNVQFITKEDFEKFNARSRVDVGDILMAMIGSIGKPVLVREKNREFAIKNVALIKYVPGTGVNMNYVLYLLNYAESIMKSHANGGVQQFVSLSYLRNFPVPLPPIEEQARIVARVDELMAKIDEYEKLENELVELKKNFPGDMKAAVLQAAMQGKLTEQNRDDLSIFSCLKEDSIEFETEDSEHDIPDNWVLCNILNLCSMKQWKTIPTTELLTEGYPVYGANGVIGFYSDYNHEEPTLLITCRGATCGMTNITKGKCWVNGNALAVDKLNRSVDVMFLKYYIDSIDMKKENIITGSAQPQITQANISKLSIPLPPIEEQKRIVEKLDKILPLCEELEKEVV